MTAKTPGASYKDAGVDIDRASASLAAIGEMARSTVSESRAGPFGHFGGVFPLDAGPDRLLVASADGIGTKLKLAFLLGGDAHRRVGSDLVNHCANDILACGARPLFFLDYVAMGALEASTLEALVEGMAEACRANGMALIGGETAEMPGMYAAGEYDAAGFIVGEVAPGKYIDGSSIEAGDRLIGLPAEGLHTNGYSLARFILGLTGQRDHDLEILGRTLPGASGASIGEALMAPHPSYLPLVQPLLDQGIVKGLAHITGGGPIDNLPRMLPEGLAATVDQRTWTVNPIFDYLVERGNVDIDERYRVFNMGIGIVVAVGPNDVQAALANLPGAGLIGGIHQRTGNRRVLIEGIPGS